MNKSRFRVVSVDTLSLRIFAFLFSKLGYSSHPKSVPLFLVAKAVQCSYKECRDRIKVLEREELIEVWRVKDNQSFKKNYMRMKYPPESELKPPKSKKSNPSSLSSRERVS
jgi:hypothetical protein